MKVGEYLYQRGAHGPDHVFARAWCIHFTESESNASFNLKFQVEIYIDADCLLLRKRIYMQPNASVIYKHKYSFNCFSMHISNFQLSHCL